MNALSISSPGIAHLCLRSSKSFFSIDVDINMWSDEIWWWTFSSVCLLCVHSSLSAHVRVAMMHLIPSLTPNIQIISTQARILECFLFCSFWTVCPVCPGLTVFFCRELCSVSFCSWHSWCSLGSFHCSVYYPVFFFVFCVSFFVPNYCCYCRKLLCMHCALDNLRTTNLRAFMTMVQVILLFSYCQTKDETSSACLWQSDPFIPTEDVNLKTNY